VTRDRLPILLLALALLVSAGFHAYRAEHPTTSYQSADERSYGKLAVNIADDHHYGGRDMRDPLHWPPGAPMLFAAAHKVAPDAGSAKSYDVPAAYWAQALVSLGSALLAALLAGLLAGRWAACVAGAVVGLYPPLILASGEQTSEPLGAFCLIGAFLLFALALKRRQWWVFGLAGAAFGAAVLTRADLLFTPPLLAALLFVWGWRRGGEPRRALGFAAALATGFLLTLAPWTIYASREAGKLVPVTRGSSSALFVGTYLPGGGHTVGMKRDLMEETWARYPQYRGTPGFELPASIVLKTVAARHPDLPTDEAVAKEGKKNLVRYGLKDPLDFAAMMVDKGIQRMWSRYARGGARHTSPWIRGAHILIVLLAFAGLVLGSVRLRSLPIAAVLLAVLVATGLHALLVSQARYNLPLMPALVAAGTAGWFLWRARPSATS
jgi:4-amino-4-deoxy-L-arabinose transferase-like glycosyltransferase